MDEQVWQHQRNEYYCQFEERWDYVYASRLTGGENFLSKRNQFILYALLNFQPVKRFKNRGDVWVFRRVSDSASKGVLDVLSLFIYWVLGRIQYRVTVVEFGMYNRGGDGVGCLEVKVMANAAQLTNVTVACRPREWWYLIREGKIFISNEAKVASWMGSI